MKNLLIKELGTQLKTVINLSGFEHSATIKTRKTTRIIVMVSHDVVKNPWKGLINRVHPDTL